MNYLSRQCVSDAPVPIITVYQQMGDREHVIVLCSFGRRFIESSFQLSVDYEQNYTLKNPACIAHEMCVFNITVRPPVSLTCIHEIITFGNDSYLLSETYGQSYKILISVKDNTKIMIIFCMYNQWQISYLHT